MVGTTLKGRYELREILGQGGMAVVYRAYDSVLQSDVAVKTIRDMPGDIELGLFRRECEVLARLNHPNIIQIFDIGDFEEEGKRKPYFVMPLLRGATLDRLMREAGDRLDIDRCLDIIQQVTKGLQAAHTADLVHRDLKPSNLFILPDDTVEIIDFGVAHIVGGATTAGPKGTLRYMAPEVLQLKTPSPLCDIFALGVIAWEMLTRQKAFDGTTEDEIAQAIQHHHPPAASEINPAVTPPVAKVIRKAMAKQPWHRFPTARDFSEALRRAQRGESIELLHAERIAPRVERAERAFESGDLDLAQEILGELEAEGHYEPAITILKGQIEARVKANRTRDLLEAARKRLQEDEHGLALRRVDEALEIDPQNAEALKLKRQIESVRNERQIESWLQAARDHLNRNAFSEARQLLRNVEAIQPHKAQALQGEVERREQDYLYYRATAQDFYKTAVEHYNRGEVSGAIVRLEAIFDLARRMGVLATNEQDDAYRDLYRRAYADDKAIRSGYDEAVRAVLGGNTVAALTICNRFLEKHPGHPLLLSARLDVAERTIGEPSGTVVDLAERLKAEPAVERQIEMLDVYLERFPDDDWAQKKLALLAERLDLVSAVHGSARSLEENGLYDVAVGRWELLKAIAPQYPGVDAAMDFANRRFRQSLRMAWKRWWVDRCGRLQKAGDFEAAQAVVVRALQQVQNDPELLALQKAVEESAARASESKRLLDQGKSLAVERKLEEAMAVLRQAVALERHEQGARRALSDLLVSEAQRLLSKDWRQAAPLLEEALMLLPDHSAARKLHSLVEAQRWQDFVDQSISRAAQLRAAGKLEEAVIEIRQALSFKPGDPRLQEMRATLEEPLAGNTGPSTRQHDLDLVQGFVAGARIVHDEEGLQSILDCVLEIAARHPQDTEIQAAVREVEQRLHAVRAAAILAPPPSAPPAPVFAPAPPTPVPAVADLLPPFSPPPAPPIPREVLEAVRNPAPPPAPEAPHVKSLRASQILARPVVDELLAPMENQAARQAGSDATVGSSKAPDKEKKKSRWWFLGGALLWAALLPYPTPHSNPRPPENAKMPGPAATGLPLERTIG